MAPAINESTTFFPNITLLLSLSKSNQISAWHTWPSGLTGRACLSHSQFFHGNALCAILPHNTLRCWDRLLPGWMPEGFWIIPALYMFRSFDLSGFPIAGAADFA